MLRVDFCDCSIDENYLVCERKVVRNADFANGVFEWLGPGLRRCLLSGVAWA